MTDSMNMNMHISTTSVECMNHYNRIEIDELELTLTRSTIITYSTDNKHGFNSREIKHMVRRYSIIKAHLAFFAINN